VFLLIISLTREAEATAPKIALSLLRQSKSENQNFTWGGDFSLPSCVKAKTSPPRKQVYDSSFIVNSSALFLALCC